MDERAREGRTGRRRCARSGACGWARLPRRLALAAGLAGALVVTTSPPAAAGGGDFLEPARDRYEPGQTVTMIGYGVSYADPEATWRREPYYGYLRAADPGGTAHFPDRSFPGLRVGRVTVQEVAPHGDRDLRVSLEFSLPGELPPGMYLVTVCTDECATTLGWFIDSAVYVGIDPPERVVRSWPLTDPAIRWLEADALLNGPRGLPPVTAADVRAGRVPPAPTGAGPDVPVTTMPLPEVTAAPATSEPPRATADSLSRGGDDLATVGLSDAAAEAGEAGSDGDGATPVGWIVLGGATLVAGSAAQRLRAGRRTRARSGAGVATTTGRRPDISRVQRRSDKGSRTASTEPAPDAPSGPAKVTAAGPPDVGAACGAEATPVPIPADGSGGRPSPPRRRGPGRAARSRSPRDDGDRVAVPVGGESGDAGPDADGDAVVGAAGARRSRLRVRL
jgi:hypothetical protein